MVNLIENREQLVKRTNYETELSYVFRLLFEIEL